MPNKTPVEEAIAEIRNCHIAHCGIIRKLKDGKETEVSAVFEEVKLWDRVRKALKVFEMVKV